MASYLEFSTGSLSRRNTKLQQIKKGACSRTAGLPVARKSKTRLPYTTKSKVRLLDEQFMLELINQDHSSSSVADPGSGTFLTLDPI